MWIKHVVVAAALFLGACAAPPSTTGEQPRDLADLVRKIDNHAALQAKDDVRIQLIEEGVRVFFELHASELMIRHLYEEHSSAYVGWARYKDYLAVNETDQVTVAEYLSRVETTRLALYRERKKYGLLRLRLSELTGESFPDEVVSPPPPPSEKPPSINVRRVIEAARNVGVLDYKSPRLPGAKTIAYQVQDTVVGLDLSWQGVVTALAQLDHSRKFLSQQQQLYSQEQSTSLGAAMTLETESEADLVKATGDFYASAVRLAVLLGRPPEEGIEPHFLSGLIEAGLGDAGAQFVPKEGSGFGQDDQNQTQ